MLVLSRNPFLAFFDTGRSDIQIGDNVLLRVVDIGDTHVTLHVWHEDRQREVFLSVGSQTLTIAPVQCKVQIVAVSPNSVKLGLTAPNSVKILRLNAIAHV